MVAVRATEGCLRGWVEDEDEDDWIMGVAVVRVYTLLLLLQLRLI